MSPRFLLSSVAGITILAAAVVADAQPQRVQVGTLSCSVSAGIGLIVASQLKFAVEETAEAEVPVVYEKVAPHDAAMSEIRIVVAIKIASNPVVTVELGAINIALTVEEGASMPQIVARSSRPNCPR